MNEDTSLWFRIAALLFVTLVFSLGVLCVIKGSRDELREEAVKLGFAEWVVIKANQTEFKWKE